MKLRRWIVLGAVALATAAALNAVPATAGHPADPADQSLRSLGMRHNLYIGTAVDMAALNDASDPQYRSLVGSEFSSVTAENVMKWESLEPTQGTYNWGPADQLIAFARQNRQLVRGHVLVWQNQLPSWLTEGEAFGAGDEFDKTQFVYNMVKQLRADGVPIDGVGSQGHLGTQYGNYDTFQVADALKRFSDLGLATAFTEVDVRSQMTEGVLAGNSAEINPRLQASAANYSVLLQACLSNRHCLSFTVWGFTDKHSWVPGWFRNPPEGLATLYDENYQPKRAYNVVKADLVYTGPPYVLPRIPQLPRR